MQYNANKKGFVNIPRVHFLAEVSGRLIKNMFTKAGVRAQIFIYGRLGPNLRQNATYQNLRLN